MTAPGQFLLSLDISAQPLPRHGEKVAVRDAVEHIIKPAVRITDRPVVQLALHLSYPPGRPKGVRPWLFTDIHQCLPFMTCRCPPTRTRRLRLMSDDPGSRTAVPMFTVNRSRSEVPSYAPATSPRLRRRHSPWPPRPATLAHPGVPNTRKVLVRIADQPESTGLEPAGDLRSDTGSSRTPSPLACRTRTIR